MLAAEVFRPEEVLLRCIEEAPPLVGAEFDAIDRLFDDLKAEDSVACICEEVDGIEESLNCVRCGRSA